MITCPLCSYSAAEFEDAGVVRKRRNAKCPSCGSYERHRLIGWYLATRAMLQPGMRMLEVAPTPCLQHLVASAGVETVSIDLAPRPGAIQMDIEHMTFADASFDALLCVHVLEHVTHDHLALRELFRVLRPGGWAVLMVPVRERMPATDEDPSITDPAERERRFGQVDHVRTFGADYVQRCTAAGFRMEVIAPEEPELVKRHAFLPGEKLYLGWKDG